MRKTGHLFLLIILLFTSTFSLAQRLEYREVFAPSESLVKIPEKPYREDLCLNGFWQFQPVPLPAGFREGIDKAPALPPVQENGWDSVPLKIPSPWNVNSFADHEGQGGDFRTFPGYPRKWEQVKMGWMRKKIAVPAGWKGKHVVLHFEAVAGDAEIIVNGKPAGRNFGIFFPFDIDISHLINPGKENEVCVGVRKASLFDKQGPYGRRVYQAGSFWGQHIAGIWQDVYLFATDKVCVSDVFVKPYVGKGRLEAEVTLKNYNPKKVELSIDADIFKSLKKIGTSISDIVTPQINLKETSSLHLPALKTVIPANGEIKVTLSSAVKGELDLWTPESPDLYGLVIKVGSGGRTLDKKYTRFGWREVTLEKNKVLLNGSPITMRGDSWHFLGIPQMTRRYAVAWFKAMKDANQNAVRLHAQPYPSFYLDVADEMGVLVLDETAIWASDGGPKLDDPDYWADTKSHLAGLIMRDRNHPSVFGWSVSNEVMPVVRNVFRDPPGMKDTLVRHYRIWRDVCRELDPSRQWISADGEDDGEGIFPTYIIHYGDNGTMDHAKASGKPWGVGEAGNAYYGTPQQVSETNGDRAYESFLGRMEGVAMSSGESLMNQGKRDAVYQSVFNMVWYGLKPLPLGMKDTTLVPGLDDGVYFPIFKEGTPGVQPERLGPYCTTLNPGYDPSLPLYQTWPLFEAIREGNAGRFTGSPERMVKKGLVPSRRNPVPAKSIGLLSGSGSTLAGELKRVGVPLNDKKSPAVPGLLFIDGIHPPEPQSLTLINKVYQKGGTVVVWGADAKSLQALNRLLPSPLGIVPAFASSLLPAEDDSVISGITNADLYFSELRPPAIIANALAGPLTEQSKVLLKGALTNWLKWNGQPEYAKTGMIIRSEREKQEPQVALISKKISSGRLIVTTLPSAFKHMKTEKLVREVLLNIGVPLLEGNNAEKPLLKDGRIVRTLVCGSFPAEGRDDEDESRFTDPEAAREFRPGAKTGGKTWIPVSNESGSIELPDPPESENEVAYLSFWVSSPRSLEDLLAEPDMPTVNLELISGNKVQVYLNGKAVIDKSEYGKDGHQKAEALKLRKGWNHFLVKLTGKNGMWEFFGRLTSDKQDFIRELNSDLQYP